MYLLVVSAFAIGIFAFIAMEAATILRAGAPPRATSRRVGLRAAAAAPPIPRIIWTYWNTSPLPPLVARCLDNWRAQAPDHELRLVDRQSALAWLDGEIDEATFDALPPYRQADWLRLQLLRRHGGIWMDASTLLADSLDWVHDRGTDPDAGVRGFYIDRYTTDPERPMVENWFIAAPPGDPFIDAWSKEFDQALALGEQGYLEALGASGRLDAVAQGLPADLRGYLLMHLAAGVVLLRGDPAHRLHLVRAEDMAFALHAALRWRKRHLYARLALTPPPRRVPALIKLRGPDRTVVEKGLAAGRIWRGSLLARLLPRAPQ